LSCDADDEHDDPNNLFYILALAADSTLHPNKFSATIHDIAFIEQATNPSFGDDENNLVDFFSSSDAFINEADALENCCNYIQSVSLDSPTCSQVKFHRFTTQVDGGADRCTTPHRNLVDNIRPPDP
jgi:hypothetical protein